MDLIRGLQNTQVFDHSIDYFKVIETHISWVLLTGCYAYKIKKPVNFGFLNYTSLEKRHYYCQEELRLNRLLSPELYLDVVAITQADNTLAINGQGPIIEYAVKMLEFAQTALFTHLLTDGILTTDIFDVLANTIACFHQQANQVAQNSHLGMGDPEQILLPVMQNFAQILPLLDDPQDIQQLHRLQNWTEQQYRQLIPRFVARKQQGFIRACHGDLHLGNIILYQQKPLIFDCIEFNENFRWIDTMADFAFLIMDLEDQQRFDLSHRLTNQYCALTGDYSGLQVLNFYKVYRAVIRAKVALFHLQQNRNQDLAPYRNYCRLAEDYMQASTPTLFITMGLSGSGKSTLARQLAIDLGAIHLRSDIERKRLLNLPVDARTYSKVNQGIYTPKLTQQTYQHLSEITQDLLAGGYSVICDATFLQTQQRKLFQKIAKTAKVPFAILICDTTGKQSSIRAENDPSEAYPDVVLMQQASQEALSADEQAYSYATQDYAQLIQRLKNLLQAV